MDRKGQGSSGTTVVLVLIIIFLVVLYITNISYDVIDENPNISESEHKEEVAGNFIDDLIHFFKGIFSGNHNEEPPQTYGTVNNSNMTANVTI